jgi:hypothetical protein
MIRLIPSIANIVPAEWLKRVLAIFLVAQVGVYTIGFAAAEVPGQRFPLQYEQLPSDLRSYVDQTRRLCKEQDDNSLPADLMSGISFIDLDGNGSKDLMVEAAQLCAGEIKGGNCSNRGCDLKIWKQVGQRSWRPILDEHVSRSFISLNDKGGLRLIAVSVWAGRPQCEPVDGKNYTSGQSCDAIVRYKGGKWAWEKIK